MKNLPPVVILAFLFLAAGALEIAADTPQYTSLTPAERLFISHDTDEIPVDVGELHMREREGREERTPRENEELEAADLTLISALPLHAGHLLSSPFLPFETAVHRTFPFNKAPPALSADTRPSP